jgi:hypothetical protein
MNLISCDNCFLVLDKDKMDEKYIEFPKKNGDIDLTVWDKISIWDSRQIPCPSCGEIIVIKRDRI